MLPNVSLKQWLSNFDLKKYSIIILGVSIALSILDFIFWPLAPVAIIATGFLLPLLWKKSGNERVPQCNSDPILMLIASYAFIVVVVSLCHWGGCTILRGSELLVNRCESSVQRFALAVACGLFAGILMGTPTLLELRDNARKRRTIGKPCEISKRIIQKGDYCFWLPSFPCDPQDPFSKYSGAWALRDEFEKWELRGDLVRKVRETWKQAFSDPKSLESFLVLFHDDTYLIIKSQRSKGAEIVFWDHLFVLDVQRVTWKKFYNQMLGPISEIALDPYAVKEEGETIEISVNLGDRQDRIELSLQEWEHFQDALRIAVVGYGETKTL